MKVLTAILQLSWRIFRNFTRKTLYSKNVCVIMNEVDGQGHIFVRPFSELDRSISYGRCSLQENIEEELTDGKKMGLFVQ